MKIENHLFISYTHIDNIPTSDDDPGWVTSFHKTLHAFLSKSLGKEARIWRDDKLSGSDVFGDAIVEQFPRTAVFLSLLSPRYLTSDWCLKEVREFCAKAESNGGLKINDKARVLRGMLRRLSSEQRAQLPNVLQETLGYEFFEGTSNGRDVPLDPAFGNKETYLRRINWLAEDIADIFRKLEQGEVQAEPAQTSVYLAECGYDLQEAREKIRSELRGLGYNVLPEQLAVLPHTEVEYGVAVSRLLAQCKLSVHMIGKSPGIVLDGPNRKSTAVMQNELANTCSHEHGLPRVIWLPDNISSEDPVHQGFIDALQSNASLQCGADLVRSDLEALKRVIYTALRKLENPEPPPPPPEPVDRPRRVHIVCDEKDRPALVELRRCLRTRGITATIPAFDKDNASTVRRANEELLAQADVVVVFYGSGGEAWKRTVDSDLVKMLGYRERPLLATYTYLAHPLTEDKTEMIEVGEPNLLDGMNNVVEHSVQPLIEALTA